MTITLLKSKIKTLKKNKQIPKNISTLYFILKGKNQINNK